MIHRYPRLGALLVFSLLSGFIVLDCGVSRGSTRAPGKAHRTQTQKSKAKTDLNKPFVIRETYHENASNQSDKGIVGLDMLIEPGHYPVVKRIFKGTPAYRQGIRVGDTVLAINGVRTIHKSLWEVDALISDRPGELVTLTILHDVQIKKVSLTVMSLDEASAAVRESFAGLIP